jgi:hypothetical protein
MFNPEESYKNDSTFRQFVDIMRAELRNYSISPAELRQAAILAATMHENEHIRPLYMPRKAFDYLYNTNLAMFGATGSLQASKVEKGDKDRRVNMVDRRVVPYYQHPAPRGEYTRYTEDRRKTKPLHVHCFKPAGEARNYRVCSCGISDVYCFSDLNKKS